MSRKKIELNLDYNKIMSRINACKAEIYPDKKSDNKKWAALIGVSESLVSQLHPKKQNTQIKEPSLEYILIVARVTGKPVEWYLYGKNPLPQTGQPVEGDYKRPAWCKDCTQEHIRRARQLKKILDSDHPYMKPAIISDLDAFEHGIEQAESIEALNKRINHLEELIKPGGSTDAGRVAGVGTGRTTT